MRSRSFCNWSRSSNFPGEMMRSRVSALRILSRVLSSISVCIFLIL